MAQEKLAEYESSLDHQTKKSKKHDDRDEPDSDGGGPSNLGGGPSSSGEDPGGNTSGTTNNRSMFDID
jgi:hypothetical protein